MKRNISRSFGICGLAVIASGLAACSTGGTGEQSWYDKAHETRTVTRDANGQVVSTSSTGKSGADQVRDGVGTLKDGTGIARDIQKLFN